MTSNGQGPGPHPASSPRILRSRAWLAGDDEVAVLHRVALASAGAAIGPGDASPVIGIANSASELKPSAMLYRNLLAIEIEEMIRANPLDGIVILANCDKTVPGAVMGTASANIPTVLVTGGAREPATFRGRRIGTGTALWRLWD